MSAQHTRGPWWHDYGRDTGAGPGFIVFGPNTEPVADVTADDDAGVTGPTVEANARLVAAAPELLETAKWALDLIKMYDGFLVSLGEPAEKIYSETHNNGVANARRVIAKAEGRNP